MFFFVYLGHRFVHRVALSVYPKMILKNVFLDVFFVFFVFFRLFFRCFLVFFRCSLVFLYGSPQVRRASEKTMVDD